MTAVRSINAARQVRLEGATRRASLMWILVALPVVAIPFENHYSFFGLSLAKLTIFPLLAAVLLLAPERLLSILRHPVFVCGMALLTWAFMAEFFHPFHDWEFLVRVTQTLVYSALVAAVLRHLGTLKMVLTTIVAVCAALAFYLIFNFYGMLNLGGLDFQTASHVRAGVLREAGIAANPNVLGYTVSMGAMVALTKVFAEEGWSRIVWAGVYVLCAIGATIPASRGAFLGLIAGSGFIAWRAAARARKSGKTVLMMIVIMVALYGLMPETLTARLSSLLPSRQTASKVVKEEARATLFRAAITGLPQYWAIGIGSGNFWTQWGRHNGFSHATDAEIKILGPHNGFFAVWIFFGLPGLALLCLTCLMAQRALPPTEDRSWDALSLCGLLILALFWLLFTHDLYLKQFGLVLGLVMARNCMRLQRGVNVSKTVTRYIRHPTARPRRLRKAIIPGAATPLP